MPSQGHIVLLRHKPGQVVACSRNTSKAIFAFSAASIFRLVLFVIIRSV
jgi:hypothetical protein